MKEKFAESELTEKIIGLAFKVFNDLGYGLKEKAYQIALASLLQSLGLKCRREQYGTIKYNGTTIAKYFLDLLVEDRVAVELKVRNDIYQKDINQLLDYIVSENIKVGLLLVITTSGVKIKRLINSKEKKYSRKSA